MTGARIIAITGGSGSGKTTIALKVRDLLAPRRVALISEDDYYHCASGISDFDPARYNFDAPEAKDHALLAVHLRAARDGKAFEKPRYAHALHRRLDTHELVPRVHALILDGHLALCDPAIRDALDLAVYVEASDELRFARRLARDINVRDRTPDSVRAQFETFVRPMHALHVEPQKRFADLVIINDDDDDAALTRHAEAIVERIVALLDAP